MTNEIVKTAWAFRACGSVLSAKSKDRQAKSKERQAHRLWPVRANRGTIFPGRSFGEIAHNKLNNVVEDSKDSCL